MSIRRLVVALVFVAAPLRATEREVVVLRSTDPVETLVAAANFAASSHRGVFLLDTPGAAAPNQRFLDEFKPSNVFVAATASEIRTRVFPHSSCVVVGPIDDRRQLLSAAMRAVTMHLPLHALRVGENVPGVKTVDATDSAGGGALCGRVDSLILVNPSDDGLSCLAPIVAAGRRGVVLATNDAGTDANAVVAAALSKHECSSADSLIILARPESIRGETRDNPASGKDVAIEMEPFTPVGRAPFTLATGRLFHADHGIVALTLARSRLLPADGARRSALVASNPGGSLELLEELSRTSARELTGRGYQTTGLFGDRFGPGQLRRALPDCDVFLWEGHHNTLINDWHFADWHEPLRPSVLILQSCLALTEAKTGRLFERGALAVVGTSSRTYSATGGAFSLAYVDALAYDGCTLGGAL